MLRLVTPATEEPVTLSEARAQLSVLHPAHDAMISSLITAGRELVERLTGYALAEASYEWTPEGGRTEPLPILPAALDSEEGVYPIAFTTKPGPAPEMLKRAILLAVGDLFENRESGGSKIEENPAFQRLTFPFRRILP